VITVYGFKWVPEMARGLVRDMRVRWALEEAGLPYEMKPIDFEEKAQPAYRALQPFSQIPAYREGELELFESGAIVLHVARKSAALMPADEAGKARATSWVVAALNSLEPFALALADVDLFSKDEAWAPMARPAF
jgi:glutathione S-transferase